MRAQTSAAVAAVIEPLTTSPIGQRGIAKIQHGPNIGMSRSTHHYTQRIVVTRRTSAVEVTPARHFATASSTMVVMPARRAARSMLSASASARRVHKLRPSVRAFQKCHCGRDSQSRRSARSRLGSMDAFIGLETKRAEARIGFEIRLRQDWLHLAAIAQDAHEPLGDHGAQRRFQQKASTPRSSRRGIAAAADLGVQRRQHEMAGQRRVNGDIRGLGVAHFADHDDVWILANEGAHRGGESEADRGLHLDLVDARNFIFDRILDGEDLREGCVQKATAWSRASSSCRCRSAR